MSEHEASGGGGNAQVISELLAKVGISINSEGLDKLNHRLQHMQHLLHVISGAAVLHTIFELSERFSSLGESLESAAIQTGLTTDELQKLQYAASQNAVSAEDFSMGMVRLSRTLYSAQKGSKQAQATFAKIGITPEQLASFGDTKEAFLSVIDGINTLGSSQERVGVIMQLLGRGGAKYLKLAAAGSDEIVRLGERAERVGAIVSEKNVEHLAQFEDAFSSFRLVMSRFLANVAGTFVPGITRGLRAIEDAWGQNKDTVMATLKYLGGELSYYLYVATLGFRIFAKSVHQVLHGGGGLSGSIHDFIKQVSDDVKPVIDSVTGAIKEAANNGNLGVILTSLKEMLLAGIDAAKSVGNFVGSLAEGFVKLAGVDTSGIDKTTTAVNLLLAVLKSAIDTITTLFGLIKYYFGGGFWGDIKFLGGAALQSVGSVGLREAKALQSLADGKAVRSDYWQKLTQTFGPDFDLALKQPFMGKLQAPVSLMGGPSPAVTIQSNVNVTVPPGAEASKIANEVAARQAQELPKAVREAHRDLDDPLHH